MVAIHIRSAPAVCLTKAVNNRKNKTKKKRKDLEEENGTILVFELGNWVSSNSYHLYNEKALDLLGRASEMDTVRRRRRRRAAISYDV